MRYHVTLQGAAGANSDLAFEAAPGTPFANLLEALDTLPDVATTDHAWYVDGHLVAEGSDLDDAGLRDGAVVSSVTDRTRGSRGMPDSSQGAIGPRGSLNPLRLQTISGPDAGLTFALSPGEWILGRSSRANLRVTDEEVGRLQCRLRVGVDGEVTIEDLGSTNGTLLDGVPVTDVTLLRPFAQVVVGASVLQLRTEQSVAAVLTALPGGEQAFNRPPRIVAQRRIIKMARPEPPEAPPRTTLSWVALVTPMVGGAVTYASTDFKQPLYLLIVLVGPLLMFGTNIVGRHRGAKTHKRAAAEYETDAEQFARDLQAVLSDEARDLREQAPDPAAVRTIATGPTARLWERRRFDADALLLRVGLTNLPSSVQITSNRRGEASSSDEQYLNSVPSCIPLDQVGVLGLAGPQPQVRGLARWLVGQIEVLHSPRDVTVTLLANRGGADEWQGWQWAPHARRGPGEPGSAARIGNDPTSVGLRLAELAALIDHREPADPGVRRSAAPLAEVRHVVIVDGAHRLMGRPDLRRILRDGPAVGVYSICLEDLEETLPEECRAVVCFEPSDLTVVSAKLADSGTLQGIVADQVSREWASTVGRSLASLRDPGTEEGAAKLPDHARLLELYDLDPPTAAMIGAGWARARRNTSAIVGMGIDGVFEIDIVSDGPHALIGGTTGSGKSELLQTLIASLAIRNRPDALNFILVDYKGGAAFKDCRLLPHTVGMVSDLDGHLTRRALASLSAELRRRENLLSATGASKIGDYVRAYDSGELGPGAVPLPRLLIVIDEFAALVQELPDFVSGLVNIARIGRSLGVHLVLATQRPSGVVTPEIRTNTNLRVALRVTDVQDSMDIIGSSEAAMVPRERVGRAFARLGHEALIAFQTARVGGRRPADEVAGDVQIWPLGWEQLSTPLRRRAVRRSEDDDDSSTDLAKLVQATIDAARQLSLPELPKPWLEALPPLVELDALPVLATVNDRAHDSAAPGGITGDQLRIPFGLEDHPAEQGRVVAALDIVRGGHLAIAGAPRSGRSSALRTLAAGLATQTSVGDAHLYVIDCGSGALAQLEGLPHCGAVVNRLEVERVDRLMTRLLGEVSRRQQLLSGHGFGDVAEQRAASTSTDRLPYLVVMVDRWEGFLAAFGEVDGGRIKDGFLRLLQEGASAGVRVVVAGDRSVLVSQLSNLIEDRLVLRLSDRADYNLVGINPRYLPDDIPDGRGYWVGSGIEVQVALLVADPEGRAQSAAMADVIAGTVAAAGGGEPPFAPARIDVLPTRVTVSELFDMSPPVGTRDDPIARPLTALVGVGGDRLAAIALDLREHGPGFLVAGGAKSGRSTALYTITLSLLRGGCGVVLVAPRSSSLSRLAGRDGVLACLEGALVSPEAVAATHREHDGPLAVIIDDADLLGGVLDGVASDILRSARDQDRAVVAAGNGEDMQKFYSGFVAEIRKARAGLILGASTPMDGEILSARLPRSMLGRGPAGRAILLLRGEAPALVQVACDA